MSNRHPNLATQWKPGQSGNPKGKPPGVIITKDEIRRVVTKFLQMSKEDLEKIVKDPKVSTMDHMIAATIIACIKAGDFSRLDGLWGRVVGKVKEEVEITKPKPYVITRLNGDVMELGADFEDQQMISGEVTENISKE